MTDLIPLESVNAVEVFSDEKALRALLGEIKKQAMDFTPDLTTPEGRTKIASQAYKVSKSKTVIDNARKELTAEWLAKKKAVDAFGKVARDFCDDLRDEIRNPLIEWEAEEARKAAEAAEAAAREAEMLAAWVEAHAEDELWERERKIREHEERIAAEEAEKLRLQEEQLRAQQQKEHEESIRVAAREKATREAQEAIEQANRLAEQAEKERLEAEERGRIQKETAERREQELKERAEKARLEAVEKTKREAKEKAERAEQERLRLIEKNRLEAQARAADRENRRKVNSAIVEALVANGVGERTAKKVVTLVAGCKIPSISIRY